MVISTGKEMHSWAKYLWPINRSITGQGVRETLYYIKEILPNLEIKEVPSGTKAFDWVVPNEWNVKDAYINDSNGNKIIDFKENNLHLMGYSVPIDKRMQLNELDKHLFSIPGQPDAIPYVTSYYAEKWGFCLTHNQRKRLKPDSYHVVIDSDISPGVLNYGELFIPGISEKEIFLSTYICHPSMANNELSGPVVTSALAKWIASNKELRYSYRIIFIPETIGSIVFLSKNLKKLKKKVFAGFNVTCIGDELAYSFLPSRNGNTISDMAALHALKNIDSNFRKYTWLDRGSDERQYCAPGIDLPIASIMRSKYGEYPQYHTSLDDLSFVTPKGLEGGFNAIKDAIEIIEQNLKPSINVLCEPQLGKRKLYPEISRRGVDSDVRLMMDFISYCDGKNTLLQIANFVNKPFKEIKHVMDELVKQNLINIVED
jgi:aminopeptidase-like protein